MRYIVFKLLFLILFLNGATPSGLFAQLNFDRITSERIIIEKGLSQNTIQCILQDKRGYMWFGSWDGLNRYDGYSFIIYNQENGLSNSTIRCLHEDDNGFLWIGTEGGLFRMNTVTAEISSFFHDPALSNTISSNFITHFAADSSGNLWIGTAAGLNKYNYEFDIFTSINFYSIQADSSVTNAINQVVVDKQGDVWIGTSHGLHQYNPYKKEFQSYYSGGEKMDLSGNNIRSLIQDKQGDLWIGTNQGLDHYRPETKESTHYSTLSEPLSLSNDNINALLEDTYGNIWIGTVNKLNILIKETKEIQCFEQTTNAASLSNNDIRCFYQDISGTVWVGTYKGMNKVDENPSRFHRFKHIPGDTNSLNNNIVFDFYEDGNLLYVATYGGLNILDQSKGTFTQWTHDENDPNTLASNKLKAVTADRQGRIWVGTAQSGVTMFDQRTGITKHFQNDIADSNSLSDNSIICLFNDSKDRLWVGGGRGVSIYQPEKDIFHRLANDPNDKSSLSNNRIWTVYEDRAGYFWVGTDGGLNLLDSELKLLACYTQDASDPKSISSNRIFSVYEDKQGIFWIGTMGGGFNRFDPETGIFKSFTEKDGLPNNVVYATLEDEENNLWISTNWGLSKFAKSQETFVNYGVKDGVQGNEFNAGASLINDEGTMFFGGMDGFNIFKPAEIMQNRRPPRIVITGFRVFDELIVYEMDDGDTVHLNYDDNFFSFEFAALDFTNPSKNMFRFMLEDYDNEWTTRDAENRFAGYKKVNPGTYVFHVNGSNNDGIWNKNGVAITIIIAPPWWETWAFRIPFSIAVILAFWTIIYLRFINIKRKHEVEKRMLVIEKQIFELEQKALRLQMNPHFIFNSLNAIQSFVLSEDSDKAVHYLAKFSHLMRMILANSTESYIPLKDEVRALRYYIDIERLRFDEHFDYLIEIEPAIDQEFLEIPPMIMQPYVENAIIHGLVHKNGLGHLNINIGLNGKSLFCVIQDNGIGREKAIEIRDNSGIRRQSRGMAITKQRLEILNKQKKESFSVRIIDLKDGDGQATGTRVEINILYREG